MAAQLEFAAAVVVILILALATEILFACHRAFRKIKSWVLYSEDLHAIAQGINTNALYFCPNIA